MAKPKITLTMGDGAEVRTLEELREHADIYTLEQCYFDGSLLRWLKAWGHPWERIMGDIERYDGDYTLHETLCDAFQIPWSEELETAYIEAKAAAEKIEAAEDPKEKIKIEKPPVMTEENPITDQPPEKGNGFGFGYALLKAATKMRDDYEQLRTHQGKTEEELPEGVSLLHKKKPESTGEETEATKPINEMSTEELKAYVKELEASGDPMSLPISIVLATQMLNDNLREQRENRLKENLETNIEEEE